MGFGNVPIGPQGVALLDDHWIIIQAQDNDGDRPQGRVTLHLGNEVEARLAGQLDRGDDELRTRRLAIGRFVAEKS